MCRTCSLFSRSQKSDMASQYCIDMVHAKLATPMSHCSSHTIPGYVRKASVMAALVDTAQCSIVHCACQSIDCANQNHHANQVMHCCMVRRAAYDRCNHGGLYVCITIHWDTAKANWTRQTQRETHRQILPAQCAFCCWPQYTRTVQAAPAGREMQCCFSTMPHDFCAALPQHGAPKSWRLGTKRPNQLPSTISHQLGA